LPRLREVLESIALGLRSSWPMYRRRDDLERSQQLRDLPICDRPVAFAIGGPRPFLVGHQAGNQLLGEDAFVSYGTECRSGIMEQIDAKIVSVVVSAGKCQGRSAGLLRPGS